MNKRVFHPPAVAGGMWPVLTHVGRVSGATYRTPLDAHPVDGGYLFVLVYGSRSDWVQNILAAGEALQALPDEIARPPRILRITEFLRMDLVAG
ncbi:PNPOx family protein [Nonomuraea turcica]|uniref:nitroreductase/quinone reductase family protein n=1 Tax=Nonomuraea sp. G32 TaxID=3067274 RepID=UPI00273B2028|nr:nitroreductase/quinone reductase family protein [Nonomuraea sp. G32]MDP4506807.1 nitroreductase/quinone reductase family protein [Nonomuraea sp. G32]